MKVWITRDRDFTTFHTEQPIIDKEIDTEGETVHFWYSEEGDTVDCTFPELLNVLQDGECKEFEMTLTEVQSLGIINF